MNALPKAESLLDGRVVALSPEWHEDSRGVLVELVRQSYRPSDPLKQVYVVVLGPLQSRAGHYHERKYEWLTVVHGRCRLDLIDKDTGEQESITMRLGHRPVVGLEPRVSHQLTNLDETATIVVACASEEYDHEHPDAVMEPAWAKE